MTLIWHLFSQQTCSAVEWWWTSSIIWTTTRSVACHTSNFCSSNSSLHNSYFFICCYYCCMPIHQTDKHQNVAICSSLNRYLTIAPNSTLLTYLTPHLLAVNEGLDLDSNDVIFSPTLSAVTSSTQRSTEDSSTPSTSSSIVNPVQRSPSSGGPTAF